MKLLTILTLVGVMCVGGCGTARTDYAENEQNAYMKAAFCTDENSVYYSIPNENLGTDEYLYFDIRRYDKKTREVSVVSKVRNAARICKYNDTFAYVDIYNGVYGVSENGIENKKLYAIEGDERRLMLDSAKWILAEKNGRLYFQQPMIKSISCEDKVYSQRDVDYMAVYENKIYYSDADMNLYEMDLDGQNRRTLVTFNELIGKINYNGIDMVKYMAEEQSCHIYRPVLSDGKLYFLFGPTYHGILFSYDFNTDEILDVMPDSSVYMDYQVHGGDIYYLKGYDGRLAKRTADGEKIFTENSLTSFCIDDDKIYCYYCGDKYTSLSVMNMDGSNETELDRIEYQS